MLYLKQKGKSYEMMLEFPLEFALRQLCEPPNEGITTVSPVLGSSLINWSKQGYGTE